jgi:hypothetical protein
MISLTVHYGDEKVHQEYSKDYLDDGLCDDDR